MEPSVSSGDDFVWVGGPCEGFGLGPVVVGQEVCDGGFEVLDGSEYAVFQSSPCEFGEDEEDQKTVWGTVFPTQVDGVQPGA